MTTYADRASGFPPKACGNDRETQFMPARSIAAATRKAEDYRGILMAAYPDRLRLHTYAVVALGFERLVWVKM